jgi:hypothetical protein
MHDGVPQLGSAREGHWADVSTDALLGRPVLNVWAVNRPMRQRQIAKVVSYNGIDCSVPRGGCFAGQVRQIIDKPPATRHSLDPSCDSRNAHGYVDGANVYQYLMGSPRHLLDPFGLSGRAEGVYRALHDLGALLGIISDEEAEQASREYEQRLEAMREKGREDFEKDVAAVSQTVDSVTNSIEVAALGSESALVAGATSFVCELARQVTPDSGGDVVVGAAGGPIGKGLGAIGSAVKRFLPGALATKTVANATIHVVGPGHQARANAIKALQGVGKKQSLNLEVSCFTEAEDLIKQAYPNVRRFPTYAEGADRQVKPRYEIHMPDNEVNMPHLKYFTPDGGEGHIYFPH